jgi:hypothetical protein
MTALVEPEREAYLWDQEDVEHLLQTTFSLRPDQIYSYQLRRRRTRVFTVAVRRDRELPFDESAALEFLEQRLTDDMNRLLMQIAEDQAPLGEILSPGMSPKEAQTAAMALSEPDQERLRRYMERLVILPWYTTFREQVRARRSAD